ncbi:hypothetical protein FLP41_03125 (plasmid) [Paracoccus marcusii]|uniref:hypothetical protein n=1 Tax=Paracoccus marcusii TaxID=59779 RepID=UPI002ED504E0|nr:hypothetical protein FLP41_03125 [Paracoccus marcusii]
MSRSAAEGADDGGTILIDRVDEGRHQMSMMLPHSLPHRDEEGVAIVVSMQRLQSSVWTDIGSDIDDPRHHRSRQ